MKKLILIFSICLFFPTWGVQRPESMDLEEAPDPLQKIKKLKVKSVSDLSRLSPFRDVVVIQKRYLPKTFRGEVGLSLNGLLNNKFFYSGGINGQVGFFVQEQFGFGISGMVFDRQKRGISKDLIRKNNLYPFTNVESHYYGGAYFKWNPFFGKFAFSFLEDQIVYFDMFFLLGGGVVYITKGTDKDIEEYKKLGLTVVEEKKKNSLNNNVYYVPGKKWWPAGMVGFGQTLALNKDWGLEWNLRWISYYRKLVDERGLNKDEDGFTTDMHLSVGVNYYFPGVKYR